MLQVRSWFSIAVLAACFMMAPYAAFANEEGQVSTPAHSGYERETIKRGWYWYEIEKKEKEKIEEPKVESPSPSHKNPWDMSVEEFREYFEKTKNIAVADPSIENMLRYIEAQDIMRKKALAFANAYQLVMQMNPQFTTASTYPVSVPGINALYTIKEEEISSKISASKDEFALVYFHKPDCQFCQAQNGILKFFVDKYGWNIKAVNLYEDPEAAYRFNVTTVPFILAVYRGSGEYMPVTVGVASMTELEQKLYRAIRYLKGEVTPTQFSIFDHDLGGPGDPEKRIKP